ncbi:MAG: hypothetical protein AAF578_08945 [Pseudomonadota bacterium]
MKKLHTLCGVALLSLLAACAGTPDDEVQPEPAATTVAKTVGVAVAEGLVEFVGDALLGDDCTPAPERDVFCDAASQAKREAEQERVASARERAEARARKKALEADFQAFMADSDESDEENEPQTSIMLDRTTTQEPPVR